ncbi:uncharacterized protein EDB91DRAFT_1019751, partial [Suillus paluster]|uniref:uncharacterized protein n=1 Tax=Suillus paluster TaxID=48578 RepID=UPI001B874960
CDWDAEHSPCGMYIEGTSRDVISHLRERHGIVQKADEDLKCLWSSCSVGRPLKMGSIARHVSRHLGIQFRCSRC